MADTQQKDQRVLIDPAIAHQFLLERFSDFLTLEQGSSPRTSEAYSRDVERLAMYAITKGARAPTDISSRLLREFVYHLKDLGLDRRRSGATSRPSVPTSAFCSGTVMSSAIRAKDSKHRSDGVRCPTSSP
jgi:site-specific recombinase XerC